MDINALMEVVGKAATADILEQSGKAGQITLGELKATLEQYDLDLPVKLSDESSPGDFHSYRGYYEFIAVDKGSDKTVREFLSQVYKAIGASFTGYKGGDFVMTNQTPVWVSEYGENSGNGIAGAALKDGVVWLGVIKVDG